MFAPAARMSRDARRTGVRRVAGAEGGLADDAQCRVPAVEQSHPSGHVESSGKEWRSAPARIAAGADARCCKGSALANGGRITLQVDDAGKIALVARWSCRAASRRQRAGQLPALAFFVAPALAAGDFGLSRWRYDSPSITRSYALDVNRSIAA